MASKKISCGGFEFDTATFKEENGVLTVNAAGVVPQMDNIADSTAADVAGIVKDFNDLLAALIEAGFMAAPTEP